VRVKITAYDANGLFVQILGATGRSYAIHGADFGGPGVFYLSCYTTPQCGSTMVSRCPRLSPVMWMKTARIRTRLGSNSCTKLEWPLASGEQPMAWRRSTLHEV